MSSAFTSPGANPQVAAAPLPPLPNLPSAPGSGDAGPAPGLLDALISGIAPVKNSVDQINMACKTIVQTGTVPGAEQVCAQIVALASSLLPMAAQAAMQGGAMGGGIGGGTGGGMQMPPPPGGPAPMMG